MQINCGNEGKINRFKIWAAVDLLIKISLGINEAALGSLGY